MLDGARGCELRHRFPWYYQDITAAWENQPRGLWMTFDEQ